MPAISSADQTTLNTFPQGAKFAMAIFQPASIVTAQVSGSPSVGATNISLTGVSTVEAPEAHFTVFAGSAAGLSDGGKARLRSLVGSTLTVAPNFIDWATYPYITVKKVIEPWSILPDLNNDKEDTNVSYSNQNTQFHPLGRIGTLGVVGYTDVPVKFWSSSTAIASGASLSSHAWTFPSGTPASSSSAGSSASPISVTWGTATGMTPHYVKYVVTDSNGKTHTRRVPVWIFDSIDDAYCDFTVDSMSGTFESGSWQASFTVYGDADIAQFPEDALCVVFAQDHYSGHQTSIGGNWKYRENIVYAGWITKDTVHQDADEGSVKFDTVGPVEKMKQLLCWPANLERASTPDKWHELKNMTCDLAAFHILTEHTTMDIICDFVLSGNTKKMLYIDIPEDNPQAQIQEYIAKPIGAALLSDRQGRIYLEENPNLLPVASRSAITTVISLDINDPIRSDPGLDLAVEEHEKQVAQVDFVAFGYTGSDPRPYYSLAPGNQYETGDVQKIDGIRADTQSEANTLAGLYLANGNNIWREVQIPVFNWRIFDIAPQEYTKLTLAAADTKRGIEWTEQKLICRSVEIEYNAEDATVYVNPSFEKDSFGPAGITGDYPDSPPRHDGSGISPPAPIPPVTSYNPADLLIGDVGNGVWWLPPGGTAWTDRSGEDAVNLQVNQLGWDPWWFTNECKATSDPEEAILFTCHDGAIYRSTDLGKTWLPLEIAEDPPNDWDDDPAPTVADVFFMQRTDNIHKNKHHYFIGNWQNGSDEWRSWLLVTTDDGATQTWVSLRDMSSSVDGDGYIWPISLSSYGGHVVAGTQGNAVGEPNGSRVTFTGSGAVGYVTYDYGVTLTGVGNDNGGYVRIKSANCRNDGETIECRVVPAGETPSAASYYWYEHGTDPVSTNYTVVRQKAWTSAGSTATFYHGNTPTQSYGYIDSVGIYAADLTGGGSTPAAQIKSIWMDTGSGDGSTLYLTIWNGSVIQLWVIDTDAWTQTRYFGLGAVTIEELGLDYYAVPFTPTFTEGRVWVFGRMNDPGGLGSPSHLIVSADGGTTFSLKDGSLGTSVITNFRAEGQNDGARTYYAIVSSTGGPPKFYRGAESLAEISTLSDLPSLLVVPDAFAVRIPQEGGAATIGVGSPTAQAVMVLQSTDDGATWSDITLNLPNTGAIVTAVFV